jgi:hypothetical protein
VQVRQLDVLIGVQPVRGVEPRRRPGAVRVEVEEGAPIVARGLLQLDREPVAEQLLVGALLEARSLISKPGE